MNLIIEDKVLSTSEKSVIKQLKYYINLDNKYEFIVSKKGLEKNLLNEFIIINKFNNKRIVKTKGYMNDTNTLYLEYINGQDLIDLLNNFRLDNNMLKELFIEMAKAVKAVHDNNIVHCDIKLDNFIFDTNNLIVKLIDFEYAVPNNSISPICGTLEYVPPDILKKLKEKHTNITNKCDIWSLGIAFHYALHGYHPFIKDSSILDNDIISDIVNGEKFHKESHSMDILLDSMLNKKPEERCNIDQVIAMLI